jgi:hypothetical protein
VTVLTKNRPFVYVAEFILVASSIYNLLYGSKSGYFPGCFVSKHLCCMKYFCDWN